MQSSKTTPRKCLCGAPIATLQESPVANKAGLCKPCFEIYLSAGLIEQVKS
jgi:hypothetical protein